VGELYLETHQGTYTTQAAIKQGNRRTERKLHEVEALAALRGVQSRERLEPVWRDLLLHHFHDILPGSSIERVNREARETYARLGAELDGYRQELLSELPHSGDAPAAINLTSMPRSEYVSAEGDWFRAELEPYSAAALTPVDAVETVGLAIDGDTISNGMLTLRFGPTGEIVSCLDAAGAEHAADGLNRLVLHRDRAQFPYDAWDIGAGYTSKSPRVLTPSEVSTAVDGPTIVRRQVYRFSRSVVEQIVRLEAGSELVRFETRVDWHERHRMLRADFRPAHYGETVACEIQFGHLHRPTTERDAVERAQFEICAHKWVAVEGSRHDRAAGFALLNDSKYGHRAKDGLLSLNLLRSPRFPDKNSDQGEHRFVYAFRPFTAGDLTGVIRDGYRLNNPLLVEPGVAFASMASVDDPAVVIETIKPAESGQGTVLRLYESLGRPTTAALRTTLPHARVTETDLLERPLETADLARLEFGPFEIKTLLLEA
jgi:alpha-mannosidase